MLGGVVLVIVFGGVETGIGIQLRDDLRAEHISLIQLLDVGFGDFLLIFRGVENRGAVLRAVVRALAIELRGVVRDGEKYSQNLARA